MKFAKVLGKENVRQGFFRQEINITTYNLCRINMFLHDIGYEKFSIGHGDTLTESLHWDDERFSPAGVLAPRSKADLAFIRHSLSWLATNGTAAIVCFPGVMYRGGAEQKIRKYLIDNNYVECVKVTNNNKLTEENIQNILTAYEKREDRQYYAAVVTNDRIAENSYNLSVSSYVEQEDTREKVDIVKLNAEIKGIVTREEKLRAEIDKIIAEIEA